MRRAGLEVLAINDVRDGTFPSRSPEPKPDNITELVKLVKENKLDLGVAFDGDADRSILVDDKGEVVRGDVTLALLVKNYLKPGEKTVYEVTCSDAVAEVAKARRGMSVMTRVGRSFIADKMVEEDGIFGGEISGHLFFKDTYYLDDALFAVLKVAQLVSDSGKRLSTLREELPKYYKYHGEFEVDDRLKFKVVEKLARDLRATGNKIVEIDGIKVIGPKGWYLFRVSNTTPLVRIAAEARTERDLLRLSKAAEKALEEACSSFNK
jgi:phosphomannomutase